MVVSIVMARVKLLTITISKFSGGCFGGKQFIFPPNSDEKMQSQAASSLRLPVHAGRAMELGRECLDIWGYKRVDELIWVKVTLRRSHVYLLKAMCFAIQSVLAPQIPEPSTSASTLTGQSSCVQHLVFL